MKNWKKIDLPKTDTIKLTMSEDTKEDLISRLEDLRNNAFVLE